MRGHRRKPRTLRAKLRFPFLFGGTFIEGRKDEDDSAFPEFPFLFGGTFIEGTFNSGGHHVHPRFPFLFGGTFIEGRASP